MNDCELPELFERVIKEDFSEMKKNARKVVFKYNTVQQNADMIRKFYNDILCKKYVNK